MLQMSGPNTPSPTGSAGPIEGGVVSGGGGNDRVDTATPPITKDVYTTEMETHTPSKEEVETNEKNLQQSASYLGQLVFKLR